MQRVDDLVSVALGLVVPEFLFHELGEVGLDLDHNVHLLLFEFQGRVKLLWVVREIKTILKVDIVEPLFEVVLEEAERGDKLTVLVWSQLHTIANWLRSLLTLTVNEEFVLKECNEHQVVFGVHLGGGDHLDLVVDDLFIAGLMVPNGVRTNNIDLKFEASGVRNNNVCVISSKDDLDVLEGNNTHEFPIFAKFFL